MTAPASTAATTQPAKISTCRWRFGSRGRRVGWSITGGGIGLLPAARTPASGLARTGSASISSIVPSPKSIGALAERSMPSRAAAARISSSRARGMAPRAFQPWMVVTATPSFLAMGRMPPNAAMMSSALSRIGSVIRDGRHTGRKEGFSQPVQMMITQIGPREWCRSTPPGWATGPPEPAARQYYCRPLRSPPG